MQYLCNITLDWDDHWWRCSIIRVAACCRANKFWWGHPYLVLSPNRVNDSELLIKEVRCRWFPWFYVFIQILGSRWKSIGWICRSFSRQGIPWQDESKGGEENESDSTNWICPTTWKRAWKITLLYGVYDCCVCKLTCKDLTGSPECGDLRWPQCVRHPHQVHSGLELNSNFFYFWTKGILYPPLIYQAPS